MEKDLFTRIVIKYKDDVFRVAYSICHDRNDAEDIAQTTFVKLFQSEKVFENDEHIKKWLVLVTVNNSKTLLQSAWKRKVDLDLQERLGKYRCRNNNEILEEAMEQLDSTDRALIHLYYYEDMEMKEIADMMKMSESAVKTRLHRARKKLKKMMKGEK